MGLDSQQRARIWGEADPKYVKHGRGRLWNEDRTNGAPSPNRQGPRRSPRNWLGPGLRLEDAKLSTDWIGRGEWR